MNKTTMTEDETMAPANKHPDEKFKLDARLKADCAWVADMGLCRLLMMNNKSVPWFILVPRIASATELTHLPMAQQQQVLQEMNEVAAMVTKLYTPHKLNIGALGNVVSQLHIHVIGRYTHDPAWPGPVWGQLVPNAYDDEQLAKQLNAVRGVLS